MWDNLLNPTFNISYIFMMLLFIGANIFCWSHRRVTNVAVEISSVYSSSLYLAWNTWEQPDNLHLSDYPAAFSCMSASLFIGSRKMTHKHFKERVPAGKKFVIYHWVIDIFLWERCIIIWTNAEQVTYNNSVFY